MSKLIKFFLSLSFVFILSVFVSSPVLGTTISQDRLNAEVLSAFRLVKNIELPKIVVPTVVEVSFTEVNLERFDFLVYNNSSKNIEPSLLLMDRGTQPLTATITDKKTNNNILNSQNILDNDEASFIDLPVFDDQVGSAQIVLESKTPVSTNSLFLLLDNYVALPETINITTESGQGVKTILATKKVESQSVYFPQTQTSKFIITLTYSQPLRITELRLGGVGTQNKSLKIRFLAQPGQNYSVYFNPDRRVVAPAGEMGNLSDNNGVKSAAGVSVANPGYVIADSDGDKIPDVRDNCVSISNLVQEDVNSNGRGDVCDDFDKDGVINSLDNCRDLPNYNQADEDGDNTGNVCDGVESRITEKYSWLPWLGIIGAFVIVIILFAVTVISMRKKDNLPPSTPQI